MPHRNIALIGSVVLALAVGGGISSGQVNNTRTVNDIVDTDPDKVWKILGGRDPEQAERQLKAHPIRISGKVSEITFSSDHRPFVSLSTTDDEKRVSFGYSKDFLPRLKGLHPGDKVICTGKYFSKTLVIAYFGGATFSVAKK